MKFAIIVSVRSYHFFSIYLFEMFLEQNWCYIILLLEFQSHAILLPGASIWHMISQGIAMVFNQISM